MLNFLVIASIFLLGTIIGSFLNVVILRYNTGTKILGPKERSMCFSCAKKLNWYELIPVASFFCLRGRCLSCRTPISWQYPLVEIGTGLIFVKIFCDMLAGKFTPLLAVLYAAVWCLLMVIAVYDLRHKIIPDGMAYGFAALSLVSAFVVSSLSGSGFVIPFQSIIAGLVFFVFFGGLWFVSGGRWLGFGDAKLVLGVGFLLGLVRGLSALALSFWIGAVVMITLMLVGQIIENRGWTKVIRSVRLRRFLATLTMKSEIPFAPFIIIGTLIAFFWNLDIFGVARFVFGI
jgi:leader peptidase (prepilin peptidase)/N-methyltransferase